MPHGCWLTISYRWHMSATIYSPRSSSPPSIRTVWEMPEGVQPCLFCLTCVCVYGPAEPEFDYSPPPLDLLTMSASTIAHSKDHQVLITHSPERCCHFSILIQSPTSFLEHTSWDPATSPVIYVVHLLSLWFVNLSLMPHPLPPLITQEPQSL